MSDVSDKEQDEVDAVVGAEIVDARWTGDYYHPFEYELGNGDTIIGVTT